MINRGSDLSTDSTHPCPSCGGRVLRGYARCPKCNALMPGAPHAARAPTMHERLAGGTRLPDASRTRTLMALGAATLAALAVLLLLAVTSGRSASESAPEELVEAPVAEPDPSIALSAPPVAAAPVLTEEVDAAELEASQRQEARSVLREALRLQRVWAEVEADPEEPAVVVLRSALCEDPALAAVLADQQQALSAAGLTLVRCHARHGKLLFEQRL